MKVIFLWLLGIYLFLGAFLFGVVSADYYNLCGHVNKQLTYTEGVALSIIWLPSIIGYSIVVEKHYPFSCDQQ